MSSWVAYRDLAVTLTLREVVVRYKRSVLGVGWALVEPLINVVVYAVVFGVFLEGAAGGMPSYAMYAMMGVLPWIFLSSTLEQASSTLLQHATLIRKINFPREILVVAVVVSRLTTLLAGLVVALPIAFLSSGSALAWDKLWLLPVGIGALTLFVLGASCFLSAVQVLLDDVGFLVRFGMRLGFYACPIVYSVTQVPADWRALYELNPLVGILWCFQAIAAAPGAAPPAASIALGLSSSVVVAVGGLWTFRRLTPLVSDRV